MFAVSLHFSTDLKSTGNTPFCKAKMEDYHYSMAPGSTAVQHTKFSIKVPKLHLYKCECMCRVLPNQCSLFSKTHGNRSTSGVNIKVQRQWSIHTLLQVHRTSQVPRQSDNYLGTTPMYRPKVKPHMVKGQNQVTDKKKPRRNTVFSLVFRPRENEFGIWEILRINCFE